MVKSKNKMLVHIEICKSFNSKSSNISVKEFVENYFIEEKSITPGSVIRNSYLLEQDIVLIRVCDVTDGKVNSKPLNLSRDDIHLVYHVYHLNSEGPLKEELEGEDGERGPAASNIWILPAVEFDDLWDSLVFDEHIKESVLDYVKTSLLFGQHNINKSIISWNSIVLFHGPPGTGKTTLCKALAQKLAIRLSTVYNHCQLIEINSHSLFSKWFSESGKLVQKMFDKIKEFLADPSAFVFVLIDEVESLTHCRNAAMNGTEPSDSLRVVNAVLTQIDQIKNYPNVLILATSNISKAIDIAFADRADLKQYIGPPSCSAIYSIYFSCIDELILRGMINAKSSDILNFKAYSTFNNSNSTILLHSNKLFQLSKESLGFSGRVLRKLPFLAFTMLQSNDWMANEIPSLDQFFEAMSKSIQKNIKDSQAFKRDPV